MGDKTAVPGYDVEFIPAERRLHSRRNPAKDKLPPPITGERRRSPGRRRGDPSPEEYASQPISS